LVKAKHFDAFYPINLEIPLRFAASTYSAADLLEAIKRALPYLLRYDNKTPSKAVLRRTTVELADRNLTVREAMNQIIAALPIGWQATALPGYMILYPESSDYDSALLWWRRVAEGGVEETCGPQQFGAGDVKPAADEDSPEELDEMTLGL
jgi:hypothetical protein